MRYSLRVAWTADPARWLGPEHLDRLLVLERGPDSWYRKGMNLAAKSSCQTIEKALKKSSAYRKIDDGLYVVKQGSSLVMISVLPWNPDRAVVRCVAQLVKGVTMEVPLAMQLLEMNALLRFGAFAYVPAGEVIVLFSHPARRPRPQRRRVDHHGARRRHHRR